MKCLFTNLQCLMVRGSSVEPKNLEGAKSFLFILYNINASVVSHMNPRGGGGGLFRDPFFLKSAQLSVSVFEICAELWVQFEETCRIIGIRLELGGGCNWPLPHQAEASFAPFEE